MMTALNNTRTVHKYLIYFYFLYQPLHLILKQLDEYLRIPVIKIL